ncbi:MAG: DNA-binding protein, partial [Bacteroidaceae bacterium]|nr:DNA-binding protein [Bacteroidaceae bacterium]
VVSYLKYYSTIFTLVGMSRLTGINKGQLSHYINGASRPTEKTKIRIQGAMSDFANRLSQSTMFI